MGILINTGLRLGKLLYLLFFLRKRLTLKLVLLEIDHWICDKTEPAFPNLGPQVYFCVMEMINLFFLFIHKQGPNDNALTSKVS